MLLISSFPVKRRLIPRLDELHEKLNDGIVDRRLVQQPGVPGARFHSLFNGGFGHWKESLPYSTGRARHPAKAPSLKGISFHVKSFTLYIEYRVS